MLKSLQMKLVLILMLLVIAVMAVVGTFLINSVTAYNIAEFQNQVANFFQHHSEELEQRAEGDQPVESMEEMLKSYTRALGLSNSRNFYIVDGETGQFVGSSEEREDAGGAQEPFTDLTPNMITAMGGEVGQQINALSPYFDVAMPLDGGRYVFAVVDNKTELNDLTWNIFTILLRSLMFGLAVAIMFSFILARTITVPVQNLTKMATRIAKGDFSQRPQTDSSDEIGTLTRTFGEMAQVLETTLSEVNGERNKLNTLFLHMADGMVAFDKNGHILHMNPAAQRMLGLTFDPQMTYTQVFPNLNIDDSDLGEDGKYIEIDYAANKRILKIFLAMFGTQDDDYSGVMAVLHDITEQTKLDSSRREFVANVSHELRTPLTNVKGYTETLLDAGDDIDAETRQKFLGVIYNESDRMTHIVKDLPTLSRAGLWPHGDGNDRTAGADDRQQHRQRHDDRGQKPKHHPDHHLRRQSAKPFGRQGPDGTGDHQHRGQRGEIQQTGGQCPHRRRVPGAPCGHHSVGYGHGHPPRGHPAALRAVLPGG